MGLIDLIRSAFSENYSGGGITLTRKALSEDYSMDIDDTITVPATGDILVILDATDDKFKKITRENWFADLPDQTINDTINLTDGTDTHIIKAVQEPGLGGRLTIGLNETARIMVICDAGDVDTDFGLIIQTHPSLFVYENDLSDYTRLAVSGLYSQRSFGIDSEGGQTYRMYTDVPSGNAFTYNSLANIELNSEAVAEQSWIYIEPKINMSHANAAYNALKIKVTETDIGDGSSGEGGGTNNLILAGTTADPDMFKVDNTGRIVLAESSTPSALANHAFIYAKDTAGVGNMYVADAAAAETEISPHGFELFQPDPNEAYPWSYHSQSHTLGKKINVDMAGAIRAIEALSGKNFIYYEDIPKSVNLEVAYRKQWKQEWVRKNTAEVKIAKAQAMEMVEMDERVLYEVVDPETGKIVKQGKKLEEKITGYELVDGEVKPKIEIVWEMKKVLKSQLKEDVKFDETDGKFYKKTIPTSTQATNAAKTGFVFEVPQWMKDRLN